MAVNTAVAALRKATLSSARTERLLTSQGGSADVVELTAWKRLSVAAMSKLLAYAFSRKYSEPRRPPLQLRIGSEALLNELFRMRFFRAAARDANIEAIFNADELARDERAAMAYSNATRCMPYEIVAERGQYADEFYARCGVFLRKLQNLFDATLPLLGYPADQIRTFYRPSKELIENIHLHSGSWGFGGARISNDGLEVSYADLGCGIRESLLRNPDYIRGRSPSSISEAQAICDAFEWGVTGRHGEHRGTGLYEVRAFALQRGGALECRTGTSRVVFTSKRRVHSKSLTPIAGVQVTIFLPTTSLG